MSKAELLAPAGDLEKLRVAVAYGADAVYMGGLSLGLRMKAKNFDLAQMAEGITHAHANGVRAYIAANVYAKNADFADMADTFRAYADIGADALIISDPGVFTAARAVVPDMDIHISTQANNTNYMSARFWQSLGAKRVVLARELSLAEVAEIREKADGIELEAFAHGAMCISYSGRCLLSSYMTGRDANSGHCAQPCRWQYRLEEATRPGAYYPVTEDARGTYIMNSKDLCMVGRLPELLAAGITSLKIEGRMKTPYYVACTVKAYRRALDDLAQSEELYRENIPRYMEMAAECSHRPFTTGGYDGGGWADTQVYESASYIRSYEFLGVVLAYDPATGIADIEQRGKFNAGDEIELFRAKGENDRQIVEGLWDIDGNPVESAPHPQQHLRMKVNAPVAPLDVLRKRVGEESS